MVVAKLLFGVTFLMVTWCMLLVWVARIAIGRGRSALVWCAIGGGAGVLGIGAGVLIAGRMIDGSGTDTSPNLVITVLAIFMPLVLLIVPMLLVGWVVMREPIKVASGATTPVSFLGKGNGSISVEPGQIRIELGEDKRVLAPQQITRAEADGECVRTTLGDEELVAMPMGSPATPAGRKHQSLILAKRLRSYASPS